MLTLSLELVIEAHLEVARGRKLLRFMRRHIPEALEAESAFIRLDPGEFASCLTIDVDPLEVTAERMVTFIESACARYPVVYAHVHLMTEDERSRFGPKDGDEPYPFLAPEAIESALPTLFWATVLGPALVDRFGRDRLLLTPAARVSEPAARTALLRLTDRAETLIEDHSAFEAAREAAQRHLGEDLFYGSAGALAAETMDEQDEGEARTAADLLTDLTEWAVQVLLEGGAIAPTGVAVPAQGQPEWIFTHDFSHEEAIEPITEMIRTIARERTVVLAALCDEDTSRHTKVPEVRRVIRVRLEALGESPLLYFQPVLISDAGAQLEDGWTERIEPALLVGP